MSEFFVVTNDQQFENCINWLREQYKDKKRLKVKVTKGARSIDQNAIIHVWYHQIAKAMGETESEVESRCKLVYGIPILRADPDFKERYDKTLKPLDYETKLTVMHYFPVTSLMTVEQCTDYLTRLQTEHAKQGINLQSIREAV